MNVLHEESGDGADDDQEFRESPNGHADRPSSLFDAPDLSQFVKVRKTAVAREYEDKTRAMLKAGMIAALNTGNFPDAAAIIQRGPVFASAVGTLADTDERTRKAIDLIATPGNPYAMFLATALPLITQLLRNHETAVKEVPNTWRKRKERKTEQTDKPRVTFKLPFGRTITLGVRMRFPVGKLLSGFRAQTYAPNDLAAHVFSDPAVIRALQRQGFNVKQP